MKVLKHKSLKKCIDETIYLLVPCLIDIVVRVLHLTILVSLKFSVSRSINF